ncbi:MAG: hypothetical protein HZB37_00145 [Planctomycetes bacterium]|nr:hypothetical protein [Planctomycetota bacterium]
MKQALGILALGLLIFGGCLSTPPKSSSSLSFNKSTSFNTMHIRRVLLLPFEYTTDREAVIDEVTEAFVVELRKIGSFEVVVPTGDKTLLFSEQEVWVKGSINFASVLTLRRKYDVDAIIFGNITHYRPYEPMLLGVKIGMISTDTGEVVWSADGVFDSNENDVAELVKQYFENTHQKSSLYGWKLILLSMRRYSQFVANQLTETIRD